MPEVRDRLERIGSQVPFPQDAFDRLRNRRKRREITRRFGVVLVALAVAGVGIRGAVTILRHSAKPATPRQVQVPLWPDIEKLSSSELQACCSTPKKTAESFARTVLRWRLPVLDVYGRGASITVHRDCAACYAVALVLQRPAAAQPAWTVLKVDGQDMSFDVAPGALLRFGSTVRASVALPDGASIIAGLSFKSSCGSAVPAPTVVRVTQGFISLRIATAGLDTTCLAGHGPLDGYLFLTQLPTGAPLKDPLGSVAPSETLGEGSGRVENLAAVAVRFTAKPVDVQPSGVRNGLIAYTIIPDPRRGSQLIIGVEADGTGRRQLARLPDGCCMSWSPDEKQIVFEHGLGDGQGELVVINVDGTGAHVITTDPMIVYNEPIWSPDGAHIAFSSGDGLLDVIDPDGANSRTLSEKPPNCDAESLSWSPDSGRLAYVLWCAKGAGVSTAIETIGIDGTGHTTLIGPADQLPEMGFPNSGDVYSSTAWSPDGTRILFVARQEVREGIRSQIYVMNADGSGVERLANGADDYSPVWSPDGTLIAFVSTRTGTSQIYVMNSDGTGLTRVTEETHRPGDLAWLALNG